MIERDREDPVSIRHGDTELILAPDIGGSVIAFRVDGLAVLRPVAAQDSGSPDPRKLAGFPLFPFSGRIARGRFRHAGKEVVLRPNFPPEPHAIHGQGWQHPWSITERSADALTLVYDHEPETHSGDWPWPYRAEQHFLVTAGRLDLMLRLSNRGSTSMPAGIGWHPYFPKLDAQISADVTQIWQSGDDMIPASPTPLDAAYDLRSSHSVASLRLDNDFSAGPAGSVMHWPDRGLRVKMVASEELQHLVVYTPPGEDFFCVEPTSHAPNAINSDLPSSQSGYLELAPGQTRVARIELSVDRP